MLALASALMCEPELLLVDELSLGLAPVVVEDLMARVVQIQRELGITIVIVEQSAAVALAVADYGYVLENGRVVLDGDGERLRAHGDVRSSISVSPATASAAAIAPSSSTAVPGGGMAELEIDTLSLRFGGLQVLDRVSLRVEKGELFALIGPNGAGKTSVLNCVSGIYRGTGAIRFRGETISGRAPREIAGLGVARTFQHGELFSEMTVVENLLSGRHTRIRTNPLAEMLFTPAVRREEVISAKPSRNHRVRRTGAVSPRGGRLATVWHPEDRRLCACACARARGAAARRAFRRPQSRGA